MNNFSLQLLKNAYEHYQETGDYEYTILPVNPSYLVSVLNCIGTLLENAYIEDVTDNLLNDNAINIVPMEKCHSVLPETESNIFEVKGISNAIL